MPSFSGTKESPAIRSATLRWLWRLYTVRMTHAGRWFLWPTIAFLAYTSASLELQSYQPLSYVTALWIIAIAGARFVRPKVKLRTAYAERICAGELLTIEAEVEQLAGSGADLYVLPHRLPPDVDADPFDGVAIPPLKAGQNANVKLGLRCKRRGVYTLKGFRVETDYPFGIISSAQVFENQQPLLVYPAFRQLKHMELPEGRRYQPGGVALASQVGDTAEYLGNREYREGDNIRDIDWRATARLRTPIIREYRQEYFLRVAVVVDTHIPQSGNAEARRKALEDAISLTAAVGDFLSRKEYIVDLFAAGPNLYHLTAGRSLAYLDQILDILACVGESPVEPFETIAPELMANLSGISSIICVFLDWNESRKRFVQVLRDQGVGVKVVVISDTKCESDPVADGEKLLSLSQIKAGIEEL